MCLEGYTDNMKDPETASERLRGLRNGKDLVRRSTLKRLGMSGRRLMVRPGRALAREEIHHPTTSPGPSLRT